MFSRLECRRVSPLLWEHAEGALCDSDIKIVEQHLKRCAECSRALAKVQKLQDTMSAVRSQELPPSRSTWHALRTQLEVQNQATAVAARRRSFRAPIWAATAAAGVIAALVIAPILSRPTVPGNFVLPTKRGDVKPDNSQIASSHTQGSGPTLDQASEQDPGKKSDKAQHNKKSAGGQIEKAIVQQPVKQLYRRPEKAEHTKNNWPEYKPNPRSQMRIADDRSDLDGARPSDSGRDYVMTPGVPAGRSSNLEYVMGTIGDSRARIIPASNTSEENSVW